MVVAASTHRTNTTSPRADGPRLLSRRKVVAPLPPLSRRRTTAGASTKAGRNIPATAAADAGAAIEDPAAAANSEEVEEEVAVPANKIGAIIGRGCCEITNMERVPGARIQTPKPDETMEGNPHLVRVRGTAAAVARAKELIAAAVGQAVNVAGHKFDSAGEAWDTCRMIIAETTEEEAITGAHGFFLHALLGHHPNALDKCGAGVASIRYGVNHEFPDTNCRTAPPSSSVTTGRASRSPCLRPCASSRTKSPTRSRPARARRSTQCSHGGRTTRRPTTPSGGRRSRRSRK